MKTVVSEILAIAQDTEDPVNGAVFEKLVKTDAEKFDAFIRAVYRSVSQRYDDDENCVTYWVPGKGECNHVGSYVYADNTGYYGGTRIGSENKAWNDTGVALVKNPFEYPVKNPNYKVRLYYNGHIDIEVNAEDEMDALEKAEEEYENGNLSIFTRIPDSHRIEKISAQPIDLQSASVTIRS